MGKNISDAVREICVDLPGTLGVTSNRSTDLCVGHEAQAQLTMDERFGLPAYIAYVRHSGWIALDAEGVA